MQQLITGSLLRLDTAPHVLGILLPIIKSLSTAAAATAAAAASGLP
jgi:hypothetical protein